VFVPIHDKLVGSCDEFQVVVVQELIGDIESPIQACSSGTDAPTRPIISRIAPEKVAHESLMWYIAVSIVLLKLFERFK
jgi:hypothetical protein